ncbi:hypothetical protein [Streptomyces sp. Wb2n-11]|uniref:hypothetical protein n=1 Tax=Streptomyces sp. Wb2n-11 TaxID=1030533 RepID=UPI000A925271|nr:hypothetical protein [Streptomyces sp. Wb2n-11]
MSTAVGDPGPAPPREVAFDLNGGSATITAGPGSGSTISAVPARTHGTPAG